MGWMQKGGQGREVREKSGSSMFSVSGLRSMATFLPWCSTSTMGTVWVMLTAPPAARAPGARMTASNPRNSG
jgi:hypothetical protein